MPLCIFFKLFLLFQFMDYERWRELFLLRPVVTGQWTSVFKWKRWGSDKKKDIQCGLWENGTCCPKKSWICRQHSTLVESVSADGRGVDSMTFKEPFQLKTLLDLWRTECCFVLSHCEEMQMKRLSWFRNKRVNVILLSSHRDGYIALGWSISQVNSSQVKKGKFKTPDLVLPNTIFLP